MTLVANGSMGSVGVATPCRSGLNEELGRHGRTEGKVECTIRGVKLKVWFMCCGSVHHRAHAGKDLGQSSRSW